ncbi:quattro [Pholidichthys leucotaenia]
MNPESLDLSIQSTLSALFPPFEATAPIVLSQLFRTIDERYHGDALQCLLDFLIPSKHLLESVQQAACAGYSDVVFRCEGWPLCLHDKTVIQLAPVNALLLRPGDFYLQVEPFGDQAARIVLKSLLEEGCREVEEAPIPETSYPCIFTEDWLLEINEGRQGTPLSRCLLCTDQGVIKLPWAKIAIPEFLDRPKMMPTCREAPNEPKQTSPPIHFISSTLPVETTVLAAKDRMSASLRPASCSSKLVKVVGHERRAHKLCSKPLLKPVGWVSPNTCDSHNYQEIEGDYVDLVDIDKGKEFVDKQREGHPNPLNSVLFKPVRPPPPVPHGNHISCGSTPQYREEPCTQYRQLNLGQDLTDQDLKCRYRESYLAALKNPVTFERGSIDLLTALEEGGLCEEVELRSKDKSKAVKDQGRNFCNHYSKSAINKAPFQCKLCCEKTAANFLSHSPACSQSDNLMKEAPVIVTSTPGLSKSQKVQTNLFSHQPGRTTEVSSVSMGHNVKPHQKDGDGKPSVKHKVKVRSLSTVSETPTGSPLLYKLSNRSHSDICPGTIISLIQDKKDGQQCEKCPKKDSQTCGSETLPITDFHNLRTQKSSSLQVQLPFVGSTPQEPQTEESAFRGISGLLQLGIISLPGSRDRTGRAVVEVHGDRKEWASPLVSAQSICELLLYLNSIPRKDVGELGMTMVINARKKPPPLHLYKALLMAQEQALHAIHSIVMMLDKDTFPRPEKQPGLQMDMVTSMKALNKTVDASQLTSDLGGTFTYSHADWIQFHQRMVSFMTDLRGADSLLQKAIKKVDSRKHLGTAKEVQQCIQEQKVSMREVLEDARLVTLQRQGGALLARMKKEEFRFTQSEDYRDALELVTTLYNQVEEKLHTLVMRSNQSLQQLEALYKLREMEAKISMAGIWFSTDGEQLLKEAYTTDDTLVHPEKALQHFHLFLTQTKEKQHNAQTLVVEAEGIVDTSDSTPATDISRTLISTFKSNVEDFVFRAERRYKELETLVHVCTFCERMSALAKECSHSLDQVEEGCLSAQMLSTLQMYEERLEGEFSTVNFQAVKAKVCSMGSGTSRVMGMWNAAWVQRQEVKHCLAEAWKKKKCVDKHQIHQTTAANSQGRHIKIDCREKGSEIVEDEQSLALQPTSQKEVTNIAETESKNKESNALQRPKTPTEDFKQTPICPQSCNSHLENKSRPREHHSEADLRSSTKEGRDSPSHQRLGRSLSEGSYRGTDLTSISGFSPLSVSHKNCQNRRHSLEQNQQRVQNLPLSHDESLWPGNLSCTSKLDTKEKGGGGCIFFIQTPEDVMPQERLLIPTGHNDSSVLRVLRIMEELLSTEREYVKALGYVREHYFPELERVDVPQDLRGQRGSIFGNLEKLHDFHRHHFLDELESCVNEPFRVGHCFLRHRESFSLYALYSKNKPQSDSLLSTHGRVFFKQKQLKLGDKMDLWSYLLKPVQRISKYSLLLQDMMRECDPSQSREITEIKAALEVIHFQLRHGNDLLAMDAIHQCDVNLKEQGQLIRQDEFLVTFRKKKCFRHIFLFQELILFSKTRKTDVGNDTYIYKQSFKTSDIGMTQNTGESGLCFEIWFRKRKSQDTYTLQSAKREVKEAWTKDLERILWEQAIRNREVRLQERVFLGIGNKPFMDIQPSEAAINDRAINYVIMGRENKGLFSIRSCGSCSNELQGGRPKSVGSGSCSSSSSSSGRGSLSPVGYSCGPQRGVVSGSLGEYMSSPRAPGEDELDNESGNQNLLLDSSESSGESVSGFSSSRHSYNSAAGGELEDNSSIITVKVSTVAHPSEAPGVFPGSAEKTQPPVAPKTQNKPQCSKEDSDVGRSTEV